MTEERIGVYKAKKYFKKGRVIKLKIVCTKCGTEKEISASNKRHFQDTKFCRSCPPEVRSQVYSKTWNKKEEKQRLLSEEELKIKEQWITINKAFRPTRKIATSETSDS